MTQQKFCFATLAFGRNYRNLARELLSRDIETHAPGVPFLIVTDTPSDFKDCPNVMVVERQPSFFCDNDKTFLIKTALQQFEYCICIDADMRLLAPLPPDLAFPPGISARSCASLTSHIHIPDDRSQVSPQKIKDAETTRRIAQKLKIDVDREPVKFVHEFLFVVRKDQGKEAAFLELAEKISRYLEFHGTCVGVGRALGLAAYQTGFPIRHDKMPGVIFFDDRIEKVRISMGQADPVATTVYFQQLQALKFPQVSLKAKAIRKIQKMWHEQQRTWRLQAEVQREPEFYLS